MSGGAERMKVVILCGGKGTRLREETEYRPKPMVEIGGRPILWHIMKLYMYYGFSDFVLCLGYRGYMIKEHFINYEFMNNDFTISLGSRKSVIHRREPMEGEWNVTCVDTGEDTPKGGRIRLVQPYVGNEPFLLTYGDGVGDVNIGTLLDFHRSSRKVITFTGVRPRSRYATVDVDRAGQIIGWKEKKQVDSFINGGFFVANPDIFQYLTLDEELEEGPMEQLTAEGKVGMYCHSGFWECMDTYRDYLYLNELWNAGKAPWAVWERGTSAPRC